MLKEYTDNFQEASSIIIQNRLYIRGWDLYKILLTQLNEVQKIVISYIDELPIGVSVLMDDGLIMCFVRKKHRKSGIGVSLISKLLEDIPITTDIHFISGIKGSRDFYKKCENKLNRKIRRKWCI